MIRCKACLKKVEDSTINNGVCPECSEKEAKTPKKNLTLAVLLSIAPGVGHVYLGFPSKGGMFFLMFLFCGFIPILGWIMLPAAFIVPMFDAYNTAKRINND